MLKAPIRFIFAAALVAFEKAEGIAMTPGRRGHSPWSALFAPSLWLGADAHWLALGLLELERSGLSDEIAQFAEFFAEALSASISTASRGDRLSGMAVPPCVVHRHLQASAAVSQAGGRTP
ncbi:hypothetical protein B5K05_33465 [Rhizobium phaseoli]|uniref:hypothetical protein n=1 Tax=Rhizobium phaseoli TaxID=396 RepID=UPI000E2CF606|nr:hypothetical protein B5K05_33465 [Rhizobium phaseoli]RDJ00856.1 hypothetical protein B5K04_30775 [Rhizobium phaseoli]